MKGFCVECAIVLAGMLSGCGSGVAEHDKIALDGMGAAPAASAVQAAAVPSTVAVPQAGAAHTASRTFSRDLDADGIDDYRVVITETFDAEGNLVSRTKDQDFDADGIVDSHVTTTYAGGV